MKNAKFYMQIYWYRRRHRIPNIYTRIPWFRKYHCSMARFNRAGGNISSVPWMKWTPNNSLVNQTKED